MNRILLDTNAYSAFCRGDSSVLKAIGSAGEVLVSAVVLGELHAGFQGGSRCVENTEDLAAFLGKSPVRVLPVSAETANAYGQVAWEQKRQGRPIPTNDLWLAAQCIETGAVLVTYDKHFLSAPGVRVWPELRNQGEGTRGA